MPMTPKDTRHLDYIKETIQERHIPSNTDESETTIWGDGFTAYYVNDLLAEEYNFDIDSLADGLDVQGANDCGIDFFYNDYSAFVITQCKYRYDGRIGVEDITRFGSSFTAWYDESTAANANRNVAEFLLTLRNSSRSKPIRMDFVYSKHFTPGVTNEISRQIEHINREAERLDVPAPEVNFYSIKELRQIHTRVQGGSDQRGQIIWPVEKYYNILDNPNNEKKSHAAIELTDVLHADQKTVIFPLKATDLTRQYHERGNQLFSENIRFFQGFNAVNKEITETIINHPQEFFIYNNGISCICSHFELEKRNKHIRVHNLQIINGAQTTVTLHEAQIAGKNIHDIYVLVKLTTTSNPETKAKIIRANNRQNAIKDSDFRSNDDIQLFLHDKLAEYQYKGPDNRDIHFMYLNKRQQRDRQRKCINLETLAKLKAAVQIDPTLVAYAASLFSTSPTTGNYYNIFGENGGAVETYTRDQLDDIVAMMNIWFRVEWLRSNDIRENYPPRSEQRNTNSYLSRLARYHINWSYFYLINLLYNEHRENIIKNIVNGVVFSDDEDYNFIDDWFPIILLKIEGVLNRANGLIWRNWQRNKIDSTEKLILEYSTVSKREYPIENPIFSS